MRIEPRPFDEPEAAALRAELEADVVVVVRYGYDNEHAEADDSVCFTRPLTLSAE